jgi:hypothetical protein
VVPDMIPRKAYPAKIRVGSIAAVASQACNRLCGWPNLLCCFVLPYQLVQQAETAGQCRCTDLPNQECMHDPPAEEGACSCFVLRQPRMRSNAARVRAVFVLAHACCKTAHTCTAAPSCKHCSCSMYGEQSGAAGRIDQAASGTCTMSRAARTIRPTARDCCHMHLHIAYTIPALHGGVAGCQPSPAMNSKQAMPPPLPSCPPVSCSPLSCPPVSCPPTPPPPPPAPTASLTSLMTPKPRSTCPNTVLVVLRAAMGAVSTINWLVWVSSNPGAVVSRKARLWVRSDSSSSKEGP